MTKIKKIFLGIILLCILHIQNISAHNNVVVVTFDGVETVTETVVTETITNVRPSFRIIDTSNTGEAPLAGRLEYTADVKPSSKSLWGKVCDDCFEGGHGDCPAAANTVHSAAIAICKDLGFDRGEVLPDGPAASTGALGFTLDNVVCPGGSDSFSECTSKPHNTSGGVCSLGDEVTVTCSNEPVVVAPGKITLEDITASCGQAAGRINLFPQEYNKLQTGESPSITAGTSSDFDLRDRSGVSDVIGDPLVLIEVNSTRIFERYYSCSGTAFSSEAVDFSFATSSGVTWRVTGNIILSGTSNFSVQLTDWMLQTVAP